ncbi:hypothetical protein Ahy_A02g009719 [Arachis hypogaea]|uniref:Cation-transporting P-type ATPase N-terminal domain-containing protein n=1 Tax=Arachis hypogaea TaxID=3818 RepID=A0A445EHV4_ARAHY|nr:hypothetical protein Ahy_A02g009719 [Arachis hypogaea]
MEEKPFPAWSWSVEECLKEYGVKLERGLSTFEVQRRREKYGWNELAKEKGKPLWQLVLEQFDHTKSSKERGVLLFHLMLHFTVW